VLLLLLLLVVLLLLLLLLCSHPYVQPLSGKPAFTAGLAAPRYSLSS
jgi:hypothetical protein